MLDAIIFETQLNVHNALLGSYEKSYMLIEAGADPNVIGEYVFMESETKSEESPKKKVGILKRIINAIKRLITNIANFFRKKFGKKSSNDKSSGSVDDTTLTESQKKASAVFERITKKLEKINEAVQAENYSLKIEDIDIPDDIDFSQISKNEAEALCKYAKTVIDTIDAKVDTMNPEIDGEKISALGRYANEINGTLTMLSKAVINSEKKSDGNTKHYGFIAFDENVFWTAIEKKDYLRLKVNTVSSMLQDPTFARGETEKVLKILEEKVPEIFEEEVHLDYEERLERSAWSKGYFTKLTYWFQENFAKSRIDYIKEVGRAVHRDTEQKYNECMRQYNEDMRQYNEAIGKKKRKKKRKE